MIDWASLVFNSLWVLGAAVILAATSHSFYQARRRGERRREALNQPAFQIPLAAGLALISLSMTLIGPCGWKRVLWGGLGAMSLWQLWDAVQMYRATRKTTRPPDIEGQGDLDVASRTAQPSAPEPLPLAWPKPALSLGLFGAVLLFYVLTLAPTVLWGDDAYFQRTAFTNTLRADGGGHWLWLQLARAFLSLPWGDVAYRVNLLSAVAAAGAVIFVYAGARAVHLSRPAALIAALSLAISHTFWGHAVRAEVYTLFMCLMALQLWLWLSWRPGRVWPVLVGASLFGVTLLGHQMALLLLPALAYLLWAQRGWFKPGHWPLLLLFLALGMLPFFIVVNHQMGDVDFLTGMRLYFTHSGEDFRHALFDFSAGSLARDGIIWIGLLGLQFVGPAGLLGIWGGVHLARKERPVPWLALAILYATGVLFAFSYHVSDQYVFYLPSYLAFAYFAGRGWQTATGRWPWLKGRRARGLALAATLALPVLTYWGTPYVLNAMALNPMDVRELPGRDPNRFFLWPAKNGYRGAAQYARDALETLPPGSVLLSDYTPMEPIRYLQAVEGIRPDVRTRYVQNGTNLARLFEQYAAGSAVFLADDNPEYYNLRSLKDVATPRQAGVIYELARQP